jgi:hypothetical protein
VFAPTAASIDGLENALAGLGLLDEALGLDLRRPRTTSSPPTRNCTRSALPLPTLRRNKTALTYPAIARRAAVSRTFLYENPAARHFISDAITKAAGRHVQPWPRPDAEQEASWRERALNAEDALRAAHAEIRAQRARIGQLLGQLRDTERELTQDAIQQITTENTTLKQCVRQLTADNRTLEERLEAARSNTGSPTGASPSSKPSSSNVALTTANMLG